MGLPTMAKIIQPADCIGNWGSFHLSDTFGASINDVYVSELIKEENWESSFGLYGDDMNGLSIDYTDGQIARWRPRVEQIKLRKNAVLPLMRKYLFRSLSSTVRHLQITTQAFRHNDCVFNYDLY